ncbi:ABC transporter permease [Oceanibaculum pacificum]|uniref:ABC transporter permease n=1 Tax=Oceanibaculum pacificum TaxID=580166 RepID=A0A154WFJ1_9PROT|nr:ABC transporter permease [Oceanibaculum pacificum]KZD12256.1 ABC transporter permease [Oceanibaculum pacificum]
MEFFLSQLLTGLASASALFLVACGLTIIFGVTRIVNFAHGSFYMLGAYIAYSAIGWAGGGALGFWGGVLAAAIAVGLIGVAMEVTVLRRIYHAPELFQLLATFGVVLIVQDVALYLWGPEDLLGPRAPGLTGAVALGGQRVPQYDIFLILFAPLVLAALWLLFHRTRFGILVRAATQDRQMVAALGVNQKWLLTGVFFLGAALAGLGGAIQLPKGNASLAMDLGIIAEVFVVTVVGGMGSIFGAYLAALLIALIRVFAVANAGTSLLGIQLWQVELVLIFAVMAVVLVVRPWGLLGKRETPQGHHGAVEPPLLPAPASLKYFALAVAALLVALPTFAGTYPLIIATEILIFALFAASLHFLMGVGGVISFGHAAYFGLGAYGAALTVKHFGWPMEAALFAGPLGGALGALIFGWFCVRLSGVYLAMLTLAFAQIAWAVVFQWIDVTGGDNGILGVWPSAWASKAPAFYGLAAAVVVIMLLAIRRIAFSPFGYALRAGRDSPLRADAIGIDVRRMRWFAFTLAGLFAGVAGGLFAFLKGSVSPELMGIPLSVDALVMVLLGGVQTLAGPIVGAVTFTALKTELVSLTNYWRLLLGLIIVGLVIAFPQGIAGFVRARLMKGGERA